MKAFVDCLREVVSANEGPELPTLVLAGDDPAAKSSTIPHQSELSLYNVGIPFLYPGNTQETLDYGLLAIALSRFSGAWTGMKMITNVCDGGGTVNVDPIPGCDGATSKARIWPRRVSLM